MIRPRILLSVIFSLFFSLLSVGQAPTFLSTPVTTVEASNTYSYTVVTLDLNGDHVVVTAPTLPAWLNLRSDYTVSSFAGSGSAGIMNGSGTSASFNEPSGVATDAVGNVYVADTKNHMIRKISPAGIVTTVAGSGSQGSLDANGILASFKSPTSVAVDAVGNIYVADQGNHKIRKIATNGDVTTVAGSGTPGSTDDVGASASFNLPTGVAVDASNNIYVADLFNHKIRKIDAAGNVTTFAGSGSSGAADGNGESASFNFPVGLALGAQGVLYVADAFNHLIRKVSSNADVTTLAGSGSVGNTDGNGTIASFNTPTGVCVDPSGNVFVVDQNNHLFRKVTPGGNVTTLAGTGIAGSDDGDGATASFNLPSGVTINPQGKLYVSDLGNHTIRELSISAVELTGDPVGQAGTHDVVLEADDANDGTTQQTFTITVRDAPYVTTSEASEVTASTATLNGSASADGGPVIIERGFVYSETAVDPTPTIAESGGANVTKVIVAGTSGTYSEALTGLSSSTEYSFAAYAINSLGTSEGETLTFDTFSATFFFTSTPVTLLDATDLYDYSVETNNPNNDHIVISAPTLPSWLSLISEYTVSSLAGSGSPGSTDDTGASASFNEPSGVATDASGNVYVADTENHLIRKITPSGVVTTLAGSGSIGSADANGASASFNTPKGVVVDASGSVYVADQGNHKIRKIASNGDVTTVAGSGSTGSADANGVSASFNSPTAVTVDATGNVYVADLFNHKIRKIATDGTVTTLAGSGSVGSADGNGTSASFNFPSSITVDASGNVYVADALNHKIRKITPSGDVSTIAGSGATGSADGNGVNASFNLPTGIVADPFGNLFIADQSNHAIRKISQNGDVSTLAGTGSSGSADGVGTAASFDQPSAITIGPFGKLFVADFSNHMIRELSISAVNLAGDPINSLGAHEVVLQAFDGNGGVAQQSFTVVVSDVPTISTLAATDVGIASATLNGDVVFDGGPAVTERGFVYALATVDSTPTVAESSGADVTKVVVSGTTGVFDETLTGLDASTVYSFAAFATNSVGTAEGSVQRFTTLSNPPTFTSSPITTASALSPYAYDITTNDPDGDNVTITASTLPSWLTLLEEHTVSSLAGSGTSGSTDDTGISASFNQPSGMSTDGAGNVYVADTDNHLIRKITPAGVVTTLAGSGSAGSDDGNGTSASFNSPTSVAVDVLGNVYVADQANHLIRKIDANGNVTTLAGTGLAGSDDGAGVSASFNLPTGVAVDAFENIYVADLLNHMIRKIDSEGNVTTMAGTGSPGNVDANGTTASFRFPSAITVDQTGLLYVVDVSNHKIRQIDANGDVTTFAGTGSAGNADGLATSASFNFPTGVALDVSGNVLVVDRGNNQIRKISSEGEVSTLAGSGSVGSDDGDATSASFDQPSGITIDQTGRTYISDQGNHKIRQLSIASIQLSGDPSGQAGSHDVVLDAVDGKGGAAQQSFTITVTDFPTVTSFQANAVGANSFTMNGEVISDEGAAITERGFVYSITEVDDTPTLSESSGTDVTKVVVSGTTGFFSSALTGLSSGTEYSYAAYASNSVGDSEGATQTISTFSSSLTFTSTPVTLIEPGVIYDYSITTSGPNGYNASITASTSPGWLNIVTSYQVFTRAGTGIAGSADGNGTSASFNLPGGVAVDASGIVYVADTENHLIRKISLTGEVTILAGSGSAGNVDGNGVSASFNQPAAVAVDASGVVYVADQGNHVIRKIDTNGDVTTLAGTGTSGSSEGNGTSAEFNLPSGIAVDASGKVYVADQGNHSIRQIATNGDVSTLAGSGSPGSANGNGTSASFNSPTGVTVDASGNVFVADLFNHTIRRVVPGGEVTTVAGTGSTGSVDGNGTGASFSFPSGITVDKIGNLYVSDASNRKIRKIAPSGDVTTLAGSGSSGSMDGDGTMATFNQPSGVAVDDQGNVYVADRGNHKIRVVSFSSVHLTGDTSGNTGNHDVVLDANDGLGGTSQQSFTIVVGALEPSVTTNAASDIAANSVTLNGEITSDGGETIFERGFVYSLTAVDDTPTLTESSGSDVTKVVVPGTTGVFSALVEDLFSSTSYSFAAYATNSIGTTEGEVQEVSTLDAPNVPPAFTSTPVTSIDVDQSYSYTITTNDSNGDFVTIGATTVPSWLSLVTNYTVTSTAGSGSAGSDDGNGVSASFNQPADVVADRFGNIYVADAQNHVIRKISPGGEVTTFAGSGTAGTADGSGTNASFNVPLGLALDAAGNLYVADQGNHKIRLINPNGEVTTLAGSGAVGSANGANLEADFSSPTGVALDGSGNVYVADQNNHLIRRIGSSGGVTTLAGSGAAGSIDGNGAAAAFNFPSALAIDDQDVLYVVDRDNHSIRSIAINGDVTTLAGTGSPGSLDGTGLSASFNFPSGVSVDRLGNVYVADEGNHVIRKISSAGEVTTLAGTGSAGDTDGDALSATFNEPAGVRIDSQGRLFIVEKGNHKIRRVSIASIQLAGDPLGNVGNHDVVLEANDGNGGAVDQSFTVVVNPVLPAVTTSAASDINVNSATLNGEVTFDGGTTIIERGFVYSLSSNDPTPTLAESSGSNVTKVVVAGTTGEFSQALTGLTSSVVYSFSTFATNNEGTVEGSVLTFIPSSLQTPEITFSDINKTYGESDFSLNATSNSSGTITYSIIGDANGTTLSGTSNEVVTLGDVGSVTLRATQVAAGSYSATTKEATLTIGLKSITISVDQGQTKVFGAAEPELTYSVTNGALKVGDALTGSLVREPGENVGSYPVSIGTLSAGSNYNVNFAGADFNITPIQITITPTPGLSKMYGNSDPELTYSITAGALESGDALSGSLARVEGENAGSYPMNLGTLTAGTNYDLSLEQTDFIIYGRPITITADPDQTKVYGEEDPTFTYTVTSGALEPGDFFTGGLFRETGNNVGTYAITLGSLAAENYDITLESTEFTITPRLITVAAATGKFKVYGNPDPVFAYTITNGALVQGDAFTGALTRAAGENVGAYEIQIGTLTAGINYSVTFHGANFSIAPRPITVTVNQNQGKVYGDEDPVFTYIVTEGTLEPDDAFTGALSRDSGEDVGAYQITLGTLSAGVNYNLFLIKADFTIQSRSITVTADPNQSKTYGESDPPFTYQITSGSLALGDSFSGSLGRESGEAVGKYALSIGTLSVGNNYALTFIPDYFRIFGTGITITADPGQTKVYGDADPVFTYTITNGELQPGDSFTGELTRVAGKNVGSYAITLGTLEVENYEISLISNDFTITKRPVSVAVNPGQSKTYGMADPSLSYSVTSGNLAPGDSFSGTLSREAGENVGSYPITQGTLSGSNYDIAFIGGDFTINPKSISVTADAGRTKQYGASDPTFTFRVSSGFLEPGDSFSGALSRVPGENVGSYAITIGTLSAANYNVSLVSTDFNIVQRAVTITAHSGQSKIYGAPDPTLTYSVPTGGIVSGDALTGALSRIAGEAAGKYPITEGTLSAGANYNLTLVGADFSIHTKGITVTAESKTKLYGQADPVLTYTITQGSLENGDVLTGALTRASGNNVGSYQILRGALGANSNYALTYVGADFIITPKEITVSPDPGQAKVFGSSDPELTYSISAGSLESGDSFSGALSREPGETVGTYAITVGTLSLGINYLLQLTPEDFVISQLLSTEIPLEDKSFIVFTKGNILTLRTDHHLADATVRVFNLEGRLVRQYDNMNFTGTDQQVIFKNRGLFVLTVESGYKRFVQKFVQH